MCEEMEILLHSALSDVGPPMITSDSAEFMEKAFGIRIEAGTVWATVVGAILASLLLLILTVDQLI